jgi:hypothetical protein
VVKEGCGEPSEGTSPSEILATFCGDVVPQREFVTVAEHVEIQKARATDADHWKEEADEAREQIWAKDLVDSLLETIIEASPRGEMSWVRVLHECYEPILSLQGCFKVDADLIEEGLRTTIRNGINGPSAFRYASKVARNKQEERKKQRSGIYTLGEDTSKVFYAGDRACDADDTWALKDPRYHDVYVSLYGDPDAKCDPIDRALSDYAAGYEAAEKAVHFDEPIVSDPDA